MLRWNGLSLKNVDNPVEKVDNPSNSHIFNHSAPVVGLFAKEPVAGRVKTRLSPALTAEQACRLYRVSLQESVKRLLAAELPLVICFDGRREWFSETFPGLPLLAQTGDGLGVRMSNAVQELFLNGGGPVLLAGSDSPDLPISLVSQALELLRETDVVTIPCRDGGYVVVGMRRPTTELFAEIPWSTAGVLQATRRSSRQLDLSYGETQEWFDLDEIDDLRQLVVRSPETETARHIVSALHERL
jgi:rSAM/selenodomain-associated transferase 1